jgi:hypothetical protein
LPTRCERTRTISFTPSCSRNFIHLRRLAATPDAGDPDADDLTEEAAPAGTREVAAQSLAYAVEAWVSGMLGGRWRLQPAARRRGRQVTEDEWVSRFQLESEYDELFALLKPEVVGWRKWESEEKWIRRLSDVIQRVWHKANISEDGWYTVRTRRGELTPIGE